MPQIQFFDTTPRQQPERQPTVLEKTLGGFANRYVENQREARDSDSLSQVVDQYRKGGTNITDLLLNIQTNKKMSATAKTNAVQTLVGIERIRNESDRRERTDQRQVVNHYDKKIKQIDAKINLANSKQKKELQLERQKLLDAQQNDLSRYKQPSYSYLQPQQQNSPQVQAEQAAQGAQPNQQTPVQATTPKTAPITSQEKEVVLGEFVEALTQTFPPETVAVGTIKYLPSNKSPDGKTHSFKSDGKQWILVN